MAKGSDFEREICKQLSLWWTCGMKDDIFWRTAGSGARATSRIKNKKGTTFGQHGDVQATDPMGQSLIDVCTIELKRGYNKYTFADLLDVTDTAAEQAYAKFIRQAKLDAKQSPSSSFYWLLIIKRDRRKAIVIYPFKFHKELKDVGSMIGKTPPYFYLHTILSGRQTKIVGTTLDNFLHVVSPLHINRIADRIRNDEPMKKKNKRKKKQKPNIHIETDEQHYKCLSCDGSVSPIGNGDLLECADCGAKFYKDEYGG